MIIRFKRSEVFKLHTHAMAQTEWRQSYGQPGEARPGIWLVGDQGIYLMSNGKPPLLKDPDNTIDSASFIVYAEECNPEKDKEGWWQAKREIFGGDDGVELIPCVRQEGDQCNSVQQWLEGTVGQEWMQMDITPDSYVLVGCELALSPPIVGAVQKAAGAEFQRCFMNGIGWKAWGISVNDMDRHGLVAYIGALKFQQIAKQTQDKRTLQAIEIYEKRIQDLEKRLRKYEKKPKNEKTVRPAKGGSRKSKAT